MDEHGGAGGIDGAAGANDGDAGTVEGAPGADERFSVGVESAPHVAAGADEPAPGIRDRAGRFIAGLKREPSGTGSKSSRGGGRGRSQRGRSGSAKGGKRKAAPAERLGEAVSEEFGASGPEITRPLGRVSGLHQALGQAFSIGSNLIASRRGAHWALSDDEALAMGQAWGELVKYIPVTPEQGGIVIDTVTAAVVTLAVVGRRMAQDAEIKAARNGWTPAAARAADTQRSAGQPVRPNGFGENHAGQADVGFEFGPVGGY